MERKNMTNTNELLDTALTIATKAHEGQTDKAGAPYIFHPIRVANRCLTDEEKIVALLHDVIEDSETSASDLLAKGFPRTIVDAVLSVTRNEGQTLP